MARIIVPEAEAILDKEFPCLNHGFVRLVDYMGGDQRVVQAARVSYGGGTKSVRQDRGLIHYLWKSRHTSPFEQVQLTFHAKMPIFVARQWVRHRTARLNEISGRYSVMKDEFYVPLPEDVCYQNKDNKQGRSGPMSLDEAEAFIKQAIADQGLVYEHYTDVLDEDDTKSMARELARMNLPLSLYTEWYWQCDLHNLLHFLGLRADAHAQKEIRVYAEAMCEMVKAVAPISWEAFEEYTLNAKTFSATEMRVLGEILGLGQKLGDIGTDVLVAMMTGHGLSPKDSDAFLKKLAA